MPKKHGLSHALAGMSSTLKIPEPKWGKLSQVSLESRIEYLSKLAGIVDGSGNRVIQIPELCKFVKNELGIEMDVHIDKPGAV